MMITKKEALRIKINVIRGGGEVKSENYVFNYFDEAQHIPKEKVDQLKNYFGK